MAWWFISRVVCLWVCGQNPSGNKPSEFCPGGLMSGRAYVPQTCLCSRNLFASYLFYIVKKHFIHQIPLCRKTALRQVRRVCATVHHGLLQIWRNLVDSDGFFKSQADLWNPAGLHGLSESASSWFSCGQRQTLAEFARLRQTVAESAKIGI